MWGSFLKEFLENIQKEDFGLKIFEKAQILRPFSSLAPSKLKKKIKKKLWVGYVYTVYRGII